MSLVSRVYSTFAIVVGIGDTASFLLTEMPARDRTYEQENQARECHGRADSRVLTPKHYTHDGPLC